MTSMEKFSPILSQPLTGKTILVTRPRDQAAEIVKLLAQLGATVELFPTIQIVPPSSWNDCDNAISRIETYDGIILTSQNAAEFFFRRMQKNKPEFRKALSKKKIYAIGKKTAQAVKQFGIHAEPLPDIADSTHFAVVLSKEEITGKSVLFPKGNLAGATLPSTLREHGALVDEVVVYETTAPPTSDTSRISRLIHEREIDVLTFFSPSSFTNFLAVIPPEELHSTVIAAIGNTTANAIQTAGLKINIVAEQPTSSGLVAAIVKFYQQ
jgi:uroporphyrinogen-III synthase